MSRANEKINMGALRTRCPELPLQIQQSLKLTHKDKFNIKSIQPSFSFQPQDGTPYGNMDFESLNPAPDTVKWTNYT